MRAHIRRCVECPKCLTRYLIGFSPYRNGSYAIATARGSSQEYVLYCSCCKPAFPSRWECAEMKPHVVAKAAYQRGFGNLKEIVPTAEKHAAARPVPSKPLTDSPVPHKKECAK